MIKEIVKIYKIKNTFQQILGGGGYTNVQSVHGNIMEQLSKSHHSLSMYRFIISEKQRKTTALITRTDLEHLSV